MDRVASFGSLDKVLQDKVKRKLLREEAAKQQVSKTCSSEPRTLFSGGMRVLSSSEDCGSETEAYNTNAVLFNRCARCTLGCTKNIRAAPLRNGTQGCITILSTLYAEAFKNL